MAAPEQPATQLGQRMVCPDPSAHEHLEHKKRLQDQSATAALYVTHPERATNVRDSNPLGPDGKLSSAGAATSLKYARAQDLPSYPTVGIDTKNSGLAAASLAHANPKDIQWYKPEMSQDAGKAAMLAANYKMAPMWQPETSVAGSKAALLAHQSKGRDWWQPSASKDSLQAATLASKNKTKNAVPETDYGYTDDGRSRALKAATLSVKGRKRAESTPDPALAQEEDKKRLSMSNSLKAANMAHADGLSSPAIEQSRLTHAKNLSRDMYTEHPNVDIEKKEKAHQDALKSASISMAKKMYTMEKVDDKGHVQLAAGHAARTADRSSVDTTNDIRQQAMQYLTLQDAAQRLAAERLAKIEDQHESAAFRDYYGYSTKRRSRLTLKNRNRRRASSEGAAMSRREETAVDSPSATPQPHRRRNLDVDSDDEEQAAKVRSQMNTFNAKLAEADKRRLKDRESLLAAAERKVQAQMSKMDEKVFNDTGKMSPAMMEEWDNRARKKAAAASQLRMQNHGKVDIGGGKFLDQSEIDAIALANVKPTLDEIHETAEKQRARDEEIRLEKEEQRRLAQKEKERNAESKALAKRMKAEDRDAERSKKRDEKIAAEHEKTLAKEERQRDKQATKEERQRDAETAQMQKDAAIETSKLEKQRETEPSTPTQKKGTWKRFLPHRSGEREPGRISMDNKHPHPEVDPEPEHEAEVEQEEAKEEAKDVPEITPTGATMAGYGPATIAAPEIMPETEATIDAQATTPMEERSDAMAGAADSRPATAQTAQTEPESVQASPASPSKKRFSRLMGKLKRDKKDKADEDTKSNSFTGGVKLLKKKVDDPVAEPARSSMATGEPSTEEPSTASGAIVDPERARSPSISSLSSDAEEEEHEERGRSAMRLDEAAAHVAALKDSDEDEGDNFEEAYDRFDESELAPPKTLLSKKTESPIRDSRFHENI